MRNNTTRVKFILFTLFFCALALVLIVKAVQRDIIYESDYNSDLRNRVIGARLINDGKLPYYYKWKESDGIRYYDPQFFSDGKLSNITASPFFHQLMIPLCNLPQATISVLWVVIQYLLFFCIVAIAVSFGKQVQTKFIIAAVGLAFLFTDAWKQHVFYGQMYIFITFFLAVFTYFFFRAKNTAGYIFCGAVAAVLILIRPNFIVFFLPFFLLLKYISVKNIVALLLPFLIAVVLIFSGSFQRSLWQQYFAAVNGHVSMHQGNAYEKAAVEHNPVYAFWEGITWKNANRLSSTSAIMPQSENGNFFVLVKLVLHKKIGPTALFIISSLLIAILFFLFFMRSRKAVIYPGNLPMLILAGFCLYMITDLFSPVYRHQYYTLQWLFPVLFFLSIPKNKNGRLFEVAILTGVFFNMINVSFLKMEHTIGEYAILFFMLLFSFIYLTHSQIEK
jgi:hypothetical protein